MRISIDSVQSAIMRRDHCDRTEHEHASSSRFCYVHISTIDGNGFYEWAKCCCNLHMVTIPTICILAFDVGNRSEKGGQWAKVYIYYIFICRVMSCPFENTNEYLYGMPPSHTHTHRRSQDPHGRRHRYCQSIECNMLAGTQHRVSERRNDPNLSKVFHLDGAAAAYWKYTYIFISLLNDI